MDFENFFGYLAAALGAGGVTQFFNWRIAKRKSVAEVKSDEIENLRKTIDSIYQPIIQQLNSRLTEMESEIQTVREENRQLRAENDALRREVDNLREKAMFRNTNRGKDGKYKKQEK